MTVAGRGADEGARAFAAALKRNRVLTALDLSANGISEAGGTEILKALRRGKHGVVSAVPPVAPPIHARARAASSSRPAITSQRGVSGTHEKSST